MKNLTAMESLTEEVVGAQEDAEDLTPTGRKRRGKNKWKRGELKAYRAAKKLRKENESRIEELSTQMHELTLKIWKLLDSGKRGTPEHLGLREELHVLHNERKSLGYDHTVSEISDEDKMAAKRYKAEKKKAREEKKARRGGTTIMRRESKAEAETKDEE